MAQRQLDAFAALAAATGSSETLRPLLERVGRLRSAEPVVDPELLRRWQVRTQNAGTYTTSWLIELRHTPWRAEARL